MSEFRWVLVGDSRVKLGELFDGSVDSVVTDPPYELGFMGKAWDSTGVAYDVGLWREVLRVLKPGGHLLAFGGSRTYHRLACAVEDAGFEIRDQIMWVYGSGFPKSLNVSKSIEGLLTTGSANKTAFKNLSGEQVDRGNWGIAKQQFTHGQRDTNYDETAGEQRLGKLDPTTDEAKQWDGWGTALKPAHEPIVLARKPLNGTVANNVLQHGTGALNIDDCRVGTKTGRWPANLIHDGSDEVLELFPHTASTGNGTRTGNRRGGGGGVSVGLAGTKYAADGYADGGSAARFFYCAKANKRDRNEGLDDMPNVSAAEMVDRTEGSAGMNSPRAGAGRTAGAKNNHPTVKPTDLMRYLCRLITPPGGTILDPFTGSGSTGKAAILEGFNFIGIEQSEEYSRIAEARIRHVEQ